MGARSKTATLPPELRRELFLMAARVGLSDYNALERWLKSRGFAIGKSSIHRSLARHAPDLQLLGRAQFLCVAAGGGLALDVALLAISMTEVKGQFQGRGEKRVAPPASRSMRRHRSRRVERYG